MTVPLGWSEWLSLIFPRVRRASCKNLSACSRVYPLTSGTNTLAGAIGLTGATGGRTVGGRLGVGATGVGVTGVGVVGSIRRIGGLIGSIRRGDIVGGTGVIGIRGGGTGLI